MKLLLALIGIATVAAIVAIAFGQRVTLVAEERISIHEAPDGKKEVAVIGRGDRVAVLACHDEKSLIVPEVRLPDQSTGFVVYGAFRLEHEGVFSRKSKAPISFSCPRR